MRPQSTSIISSSYSTTKEFFPICPRPPRGMSCTWFFSLDFEPGERLRLLVLAINPPPILFLMVSRKSGPSVRRTRDTIAHEKGRPLKTAPIAPYSQNLIFSTRSNPCRLLFLHRRNQGPFQA